VLMSCPLPLLFALDGVTAPFSCFSDGFRVAEKGHLNDLAAGTWVFVSWPLLLS
jgi:hypothetical protein